MPNMMSDFDKTNILVVDDLYEKRLGYEAVLEELGQNVILVGSGAEALKQVLLHDFAVILLDVNMPEIDGFETARLIRCRKRSATTPIIFLTAFADELRSAEGYATGAVDYLSTPVYPEILRAKVRVFIELFQMRREVARQAEEKARQAATEEANRRLSFLAKAGAVLGRSLDLQATIRDIVRLPVAVLADSCMLSLEWVRGAPCKGLCVEIDSDGSTLPKELTDFDEFPSEFRDDIRQVAISGQVESRSASSPEGETLPHSLIIPLQARGRTMAVLVLSRKPSGRTYTADDLTVATAFASRSAIAMDNALLHEEIRRTDRQKNEFLSMLAHELRNPLAPIRNAVHLLGLRTPSEPEMKWVREVIERQVTQMVRLVDDLLDVSRLTSGKIRLHQEQISLATVIEHAMEASRPLIDAHRQQLAVSVPTDPVWINGDLARLAQVLTNLLNNAAKYTEEGGEIWLTSQMEDEWVVITVRDTGIGIPPHMLEDVFDLFTQVDRTIDRSQGGLGIGLTLVRQLIAMHGGTVEAHSEGIGSGAEFVVRLPLIKESISSQPECADGNGESAASAKVLVVDDNIDSADTLASLLRLAGHRVQVAYDGPTGLDLARTFQPEVLMLDIGLPGMDGYAVAQRVRQWDSHRPTLIIAVSGYGQPKDELRSRQSGFDHFLVKPVDFRILQSLLLTANGFDPVGAK
jgi:signal transduction histidine kinase/DNA-binding response OmpR family regulator